MTGTVIPYVSDVSHLSLVTFAYPFDLLCTIVFDPVHLLGVVLPQPLELLAFVLFDIVQHLIDLFGPWGTADASVTHAPSHAAASVKEERERLNDGRRRWQRVRTHLENISRNS